MAKFSALRVIRELTILLNGKTDVVFPLFSPLGERKWVEGWDPVLVYPASGVVEEDSIFLTHDHASGQPITWMTVQYDAATHSVRYMRVHQNDHTADIRVRCVEGDQNSTKATIRYVFTGLSEKGNASIKVFTDEHFRDWINSWEIQINRFLLAGIPIDVLHPDH